MSKYPIRCHSILPGVWTHLNSRLWLWLTVLDPRVFRWSRESPELDWAGWASLRSSLRSRLRRVLRAGQAADTRNLWADTPRPSEQTKIRSAWRESWGVI